jgi:hypothetical protein
VVEYAFAMVRVLLPVALVVGCSKGEVGGADPEAPLRELTQAFVRGDASAMRHALVSPDRLRKALDCPTDELFGELNGAIDAVAEVAKELADVRPEVTISKLVHTGTTRIAKGDRFRGCVASEPFEVRAYSFELTLAALGRKDSTTDRGEVIQLDGRWYALLKE